MTIETAGGLLSAWRESGGMISVDMGKPRFAAQDIPLSQDFPDTSAIDLTFRLGDGRILEKPSVVNAGNPHCIFWVEDVESYPLCRFRREA